MRKRSHITLVTGDTEELARALGDELSAAALAVDESSQVIPFSGGTQAGALQAEMRAFVYDEPPYPRFVSDHTILVYTTRYCNIISGGPSAQVRHIADLWLHAKSDGYEVKKRCR